MADNVIPDELEVFVAPGDQKGDSKPAAEPARRAGRSEQAFETRRRNYSKITELLGPGWERKHTYTACLKALQGKVTPDQIPIRKSTWKPSRSMFDSECPDSVAKPRRREPQFPPRRMTARDKPECPPPPPTAQALLGDEPEPEPEPEPEQPNAERSVDEDSKAANSEQTAKQSAHATKIRETRRITREAITKLVGDGWEDKITYREGKALLETGKWPEGRKSAPQAENPCGLKREGKRMAQKTASEPSAQHSIAHSYAMRLRW